VLDLLMDEDLRYRESLERELRDAKVSTRENE
jgi:hypothetical protein